MDLWKNKNSHFIGGSFSIFNKDKLAAKGEINCQSFPVD